MLALHIAIGIWLGGISLAATFVAVCEVLDRIKEGKRCGHPWWHNLIRN